MTHVAQPLLQLSGREGILAPSRWQHAQGHCATGQIVQGGKHALAAEHCHQGVHPKPSWRVSYITFEAILQVPSFDDRRRA